MDAKNDRDRFAAAWKSRFPNVEMPPWQELEHDQYASSCQKKMDLMKLALEMEEFQLQWMKDNKSSSSAIQQDLSRNFIHRSDSQGNDQIGLSSMLVIYVGIVFFFSLTMRNMLVLSVNARFHNGRYFYLITIIGCYYTI